MYRAIVTATLLLQGTVTAAWPADQSNHRSATDVSGGRTSCMIDVLHSEELPGAPIFQHLVRARLLVTPTGRPPFETTVEKYIPWQVPPPRRGQRLKILCDPSAFSPFPFEWVQ